MISLFPSITLALAGMVVASPLKRGTAGSLSGRQVSEYGNLEDCPNRSLRPSVVDAHTEALALANGAVAYINANGPTVEPFTTYFGSTQDATKQLRVFSDAAAEHSDTLHCTDAGVICDSIPLIGDFGAYGTGVDIFFCPSFYNQVPTGNLCTQSTVDQGGIRGATTLFVIMENVDQIGDHLTTEDCSDARNIASTDPEKASDSAANYMCFAMQVFVNTVCE